MHPTMRRITRHALTLTGAYLLASAILTPASAQDETAASGKRYEPAPIVVQNYRPTDQRGIQMFEPPKEALAPYTGFQLQWGAAFTQQGQSLDHHNSADSLPLAGADANELIKIGKGFNNAVANLYMNAQLARGIRVAMTSYLSSRHHNETWVKDGYLLIDGSPYENELLDGLMEYVTLRVGHFEVNYGDAHFRRSDNGMAMYNPLVGNLLMDAFTTEIGMEAYVRANGFLVMAGATGGEIRGQVQRPDDRSASYLAKLGYDGQVNPNLRVRLTGSLYQNNKSLSNTLYTGSRAGSRYYSVLENTKSTEAAQAWSGDLQPGFRYKVRAWVVNPFVKFHGLELFGNIEEAEGRMATETANRTWKQYAGEALYRLAGDHLYVVGRYNTVEGRLAGINADLTIDRVQAGGGWFITPNLELKAEYVKQDYRGFPSNDIRHGGRFEGMMFEGVVAF